MATKTDHQVRAETTERQNPATPTPARDIEPDIEPPENESQNPEGIPEKQVPFSELVIEMEKTFHHREQHSEQDEHERNQVMQQMFTIAFNQQDRKELPDEKTHYPMLQQEELQGLLRLFKLEVVQHDGTVQIWLRRLKGLAAFVYDSRRTLLDGISLKESEIKVHYARSENPWSNNPLLKNAKEDDDDPMEEQHSNIVRFRTAVYSPADIAEMRDIYNTPYGFPTELSEPTMTEKKIIQGLLEGTILAQELPHFLKRTCNNEMLRVIQNTIHAQVEGELMFRLPGQFPVYPDFQNRDRLCNAVLQGAKDRGFNMDQLTQMLGETKQVCYNAQQHSVHLIYWTREVAEKWAKIYKSIPFRSQRFVLTNVHPGVDSGEGTPGDNAARVWARQIGRDGITNERQHDRYKIKLFNISRFLDEAAVDAFLRSRFDGEFSTASSNQWKSAANCITVNAHDIAKQKSTVTSFEELEDMWAKLQNNNEITEQPIASLTTHENNENDVEVQAETTGAMPTSISPWITPKSRGKRNKIGQHRIQGKNTASPELQVSMNIHQDTVIDLVSEDESQPESPTRLDEQTVKPTHIGPRQVHRPAALSKQQRLIMEAITRNNPEPNWKDTEKLRNLDIDDIKLTTTTGHQVLEKCGLKSVVTPGTGNCQYYAIAMALLNTDFATAANRKAIDNLTAKLKKGFQMAMMHGFDEEYQHDERKLRLLACMKNTSSLTETESKQLLVECMEDIAQFWRLVGEPIPERGQTTTSRHASRTSRKGKTNRGRNPATPVVQQLLLELDWNNQSQFQTLKTMTGAGAATLQHWQEQLLANGVSSATTPEDSDVEMDDS
ncbi:unnamed protein product [Phytophthora fragariaefolia]|uniref:Unnamed protein product n=1 Tax=Phytophthora fragariaefolia TaxID=1490495 RepID=A0A9W6XUD2_9STRA|nr:unnamed protein product [Phytophthora fragariaefolia]